MQCSQDASKFHIHIQDGLAAIDLSKLLQAKSGIHHLPGLNELAKPKSITLKLSQGLLLSERIIRLDGVRSKWQMWLATCMNHSVCTVARAVSCECAEVVRQNPGQDAGLNRPCSMLCSLVQLSYSINHYEACVVAYCALTQGDAQGVSVTHINEL